MAALFFADLVRETSWATGAGALALGGALPGHRSFAAAVPAGARFHYCIAGVTQPEEWETGEGEIAGGALVRTPLASSAAGAAVNFSSGLKTVALTVAAAWFTGQGSGVAGIADVPGLPEALAAKAPLASPALTGTPTAPTAVAGTSGTQIATTGFVRGEVAAVVGAAPAGLDTLAELAAAIGNDPNHAASVTTALAGKQPLDDELTAIAGLASAADRLPYFTGAGTAALATFTAAGRALVDDADAATQRTTLGLGTAAVKNAGTSGDTVPVCNGAAVTWAAGATFGGKLTLPTSAWGLAGADGVDRIYFGNLTSNVYHSYINHVFRTGNNTAVDRFVMSDTGLNLIGTYSVGGTQVVTSRRTGWGAPTGTATRTAFDTATATTAQLAERLKALIDDLTAHGLIGA